MSSFWDGVEFHAKLTRSLNPDLNFQLLQYLKIWGLGMLVKISIFKGKWSEVILGREETTELGRMSSQAELMRTRSSLLRIGGVCMLLHVKFLSERGISWRERSQIVSLERFSFWDMWRELRSWGKQTELKSPARSHGPCKISSNPLGSWKKVGLSSSILGPYTLVTQNKVALDSDSNWAEIEKDLETEEMNLNLFGFQAIKKPRIGTIHRNKVLKGRGQKGLRFKLINLSKFDFLKQHNIWRIMEECFLDQLTFSNIAEASDILM
jgi:hypothetical protein